MEIAFINVNFSYENVTSTQLSELLLCLLFLKNNHPKMKGAYLGVTNSAPFQIICTHILFK